MPDDLDLDAKIARLQRAVAAADREAITAQLTAIERELEAMNPLVRGMTYAHVQSVIGRPDRAVAVVEDLLELMPDRAVVYYQLGCYRQAAQDDEGALAAFTRATELDPAQTDAWINRGLLLDARGEPEAAIEAYRHAILRAPAELDAWRNLGNSLAAAGYFDEALEAYRTASGLRPGDASLARLMASVHQAKGELEQANALLPAALRRTLGAVEEVCVEAGDDRLCCRFHATAERRLAYRTAAHSLLNALVPSLVVRDASAFPWAHEHALVVRHAGRMLLCDADPRRPGLPDRFFDATGAVAREAEAEPGRDA